MWAAHYLDAIMAVTYGSTAVLGTGHESGARGAYRSKYLERIQSKAPSPNTR